MSFRLHIHMHFARLGQHDMCRGRPGAKVHGPHFSLSCSSHCCFVQFPHPSASVSFRELPRTSVSAYIVQSRHTTGAFRESRGEAVRFCPRRSFNDRLMVPKRGIGRPAKPFSHESGDPRYGPENSYAQLESDTTTTRQSVAREMANWRIP